MDRDTAEHFYCWLTNHVADDEQHEVEQSIHKLVRDYPDLVERMSWPEIRNLAERNN
jgi:diketogulonate reductase-like aldo/keto reductase